MRWWRSSLRRRRLLRRSRAGVRVAVGVGVDVGVGVSCRRRKYMDQQAVFLTRAFLTRQLHPQSGLAQLQVRGMGMGASKNASELIFPGGIALSHLCHATPPVSHLPYRPRTDTHARAKLPLCDSCAFRDGPRALCGVAVAGAQLPARSSASSLTRPCPHVPGQGPPTHHLASS